jgi:hypothetical protein
MSMQSYATLTDAEDEVVGALQREGGVLSFPELLSVTKLPYEYLGRVLDRLRNEERVEISEEGPDIRLVRLAKSTRGLGRLFGF